jgi:hypothetical protein
VTKIQNTKVPEIDQHKIAVVDTDGCTGGRSTTMTMDPAAIVDSGIGSSRVSVLMPLQRSILGLEEALFLTMANSCFFGLLILLQSELTH